MVARHYHGFIPMDPFTTRSKWIGRLLLTGLFVGLSAWSWRKWPDPWVDFGNQLYLAWQLSEGKVLYLDIPHYYGPLSAYFNAFLFKVFGVSFNTLMFANIALLALLGVMVDRIFSAAFGGGIAKVVVAALLSLFGFSQYVGNGNYNFIAPYSHEAVHGIILSVAALFSLQLHDRNESRRYLVLSGLLLGLVFLSKPEVFLAAALAVLTYMTCRGAGIRSLGVLIGFAVVPFLVFLVFFRLQMSWPLAVKGALGAWKHLFNDHVVLNVGYLKGLGLDQPMSNFMIMIRAFITMAGAVALALGLERASRNLRPAWRAPGAALLAGVILAYGFMVENSVWISVGRALPLVSLGALLYFSYRLWTTRRQGLEPDHRGRHALLCAWAMFSLVLLGKILMNARFHNFGFYLAMPAALLLVAMVMSLSRGWVYRCLALALICSCSVFYLRRSNAYYSTKTLQIGNGGDRIMIYGPRTDPRSAFLKEALTRAESIMVPGATLSVLPAAPIFNYLLRRADPTHYTESSLMEILISGEDRMLRTYRARRPDYVIFFRAGESSEFGFGEFGEDPRFGRKLKDWVFEGYDEIAKIGMIQLFRRKGDNPLADRPLESPTGI